MNHQDYNLEEVVNISKRRKRFQIFVVPYKPKSYKYWVLGFHSEVESGKLVDKDQETKLFISLDLMFKFINSNFKIDMFNVVVDL